MKAFNAALHPTLKRVEPFHVDMTKMAGLEASPDGIGSLQKEHHLKSSIPAEFMPSSTVADVGCQELVDMYNVTHIDLLQIDVEGFDYEVLKMVLFDQFKPLLIKYECVNLSEGDREKELGLLSGQGCQTEVEAEDVVAILS